MVSVVAKNYAQVDKLEAILALYEELVSLTRKESGCIQYELYHDINQPECLTMIETWESKEALDAHLVSEHFTRLVPQLKPLMAKPGEMTILKKYL